MTSQIAVRLPQEVLAGIDRLAAATHTTRSDLIRAALEDLLRRRAAERDAQLYASVPMTAAELALADDSDAWSPTPQW